MRVDDPLDVTNSTRHPPYVSVRGSSSSVQDGRNSHIDLLSQVLRELRLDSASFRSLLLRGEWRMRFDGPLRGVHIVVSGHPHLLWMTARHACSGRVTWSCFLGLTHTR